MAIPADTVWEVRPSGSDTLCSGGWSFANAGMTGTDWTVQNGAKYTYTSDLSGVGTTTLTSAGANFTTDLLGNTIQIAGQGVYCIVGFTSTSIVTVDRNLGTFATTTGYVGGGFATMGKAGSVKVPGNTIYIKQGTYTYSNTANVAGGKLQFAGDASHQSWVVGYNTTRTKVNTDVGPTLSPTTNSTTFAIDADSYCTVLNIIADNTSSAKTSCIAFGCDQESYIIRCQAKAFNIGYQTTGNSGNGTLATFIGNYAYKCGTSYNLNTGRSHKILYCVSEDVASNSNVDQFYTSAEATQMVRCISKFAGSGGNAFTFAGASGSSAINCVAWKPQVNSFAMSGAAITGVNCISEGAGQGGSGYGYQGATANILINCASDGAGSGATDGLFGLLIGQILFTGTAFTSAGGGDFSLNNTAGAGALLRAVGYPTSFPGLSTLNYLDIGAAQSQGSAAGGSAFLIANFTANFEG